MSNLTESVDPEHFFDVDLIKNSLKDLVANSDIEAVHILLGLFVIILISLACIAVIECVRSCCDNKRYTFQDDARV